jgi:hypothetical protein
MSSQSCDFYNSLKFWVASNLLEGIIYFTFNISDGVNIQAFKP